VTSLTYLEDKWSASHLGCPALFSCCILAMCFIPVGDLSQEEILRNAHLHFKITVAWACVQLRMCNSVDCRLRAVKVTSR